MHNIVAEILLIIIVAVACALIYLWCVDYVVDSLNTVTEVINKILMRPLHKFINNDCFSYVKHINIS